ncbi:MAG: DUF1778 domain-containing protein [Chlorobium sp.]|nr:MAG: DUF1778 domain-containing protein [Chlorobium sp.]
MPQNPAERNERLWLRISSEEKSLLMRASVLQNTSLTDFVTNTAVSEAFQIPLFANELNDDNQIKP